MIEYLGYIIEIDEDILVETKLYSKELSTCRTTDSDCDKNISLNDATIDDANYSILDKSVESTIREYSNDSPDIRQDVSERNEELINKEMENDMKQVVDIDAKRYIIHKSKLGTLQNKASKYDQLMKQVQKSRYDGTPLGDAMIGYASSLVPQCGHYGVAAMLPFMIGSLFANAGLKFDVNKIVNSQPSEKKHTKL